MDDLKKRVSESLQVKLSVTLLLVIFTVATLAGVFSFLSAFEEAHELQDDVLQQIAQLMDRQHLWPASPIVGASLKNSDEQSRVIVQNIGDARLVPTTQAARTQLELPIKLSDGLHTLKSKGEVFRVLVKTTSFGQRIAVAQAASFRNEIARDSALRTAMPLLILVPVLLLIVADLVRKTLRPIAALSREIDQRTEQELHPVQANHLPIEIRPLAVAINRLLDRTNKAMDAQRRFLASAAHELHSPLTALSLQAQRLSAAQMSDQQAHERLTILHQGINRSRNLLDQMLALAKAQSSTHEPKAMVSIQDIYRRILEDLMPLAQDKQIDIGVDAAQEVSVWISELDMLCIVKNLVDNAIRYTPPGGRVDLAVGIAQGCAVLRIQDSGPGIALFERERVFDPFYRTLGSDQIGSGLGLSIVKTISKKVGIDIQLQFSDQKNQTGLIVIITIPANK